MVAAEDKMIVDWGQSEETKEEKKKQKKEEKPTDKDKVCTFTQGEELQSKTPWESFLERKKAKKREHKDKVKELKRKAKAEREEEEEGGMCHLF